MWDDVADAVYVVDVEVFEVAGEGNGVVGGEESGLEVFGGAAEVGGAE